MRERPDDSAANHYYIHALEGTPHPEQALHRAQILPGLAPASGHTVHMPGHVFFRRGDYGLAEQAFTASTQVDERYMREQHIRPHNDWNYVYNPTYAIANLLEEGELREATALSLKLSGARGELESTLYVYSARNSSPARPAFASRTPNNSRRRAQCWRDILTWSFLRNPVFAGWQYDRCRIQRRVSGQYLRHGTNRAEQFR